MVLFLRNARVFMSRIGRSKVVVLSDKHKKADQYLASILPKMSLVERSNLNEIIGRQRYMRVLTLERKKNVNILV